MAAKAVLTGAVNGAAVAAAGGDEKAVKAAFGLGVATVMIREGYRKLTDLELDKHRLRSSTGEAYCLAEVPDFSGPAKSCWAPKSALHLRG
jgi:hypothetical protein